MERPSKRTKTNGGGEGGEAGLASEADSGGGVPDDADRRDTLRLIQQALTDSGFA